MTEDWKPNSYEGQNSDGQNRERRPYNANRSSYGSYGNSSSSYDRSDSRSSYNNRPYSGNSGNYERRDDGYSRPRPSYNNGESGYTPRPRPSYDRSQSSYDRPQRSYGDRPSSGGYQSDDTRPRRPRVGENSGGGGYSSRYHSQGGGYNNGGYNNNGYGRPQLRNSMSGRPNPNSKYSLQKQLKYREEHFDPNEPIRLNKYLANAGVCSRREADEFIKAGVVKVNDVLVTEVGTKVKRSDTVSFHNEPVRLEHKIYVLLNKPRNCVTTADDPQERLTVIDLVKSACTERIFPVGRLDRNTTGVLLLTNDGDLASKLTHPKFLKKKIYHVWLDKDVTVEDMQKLAEGIELEDGEIHADAVSYVTDEAKDQVGIEIHSGRNRVVRRMFETLGYKVLRLDRVYFAGLTKKNVKKGHWRFLTEPEVNMLRMGSFE